MAFPKEGFVSPVTYNGLPYISEVSRVPVDNPNDLQEPRSLLVKYQAPKTICIRLIHKPFDINAGEAIVAKKIDIPKHGTVSVLGPTKVTVTQGLLHGLHFLVDANGQLHPYDCSPSPLPDVSGFEPLFADFCRLVVERGLQRKFGWKTGRDSESDMAGWTEFEFPEDRGTIMIPKGLPTPEGEYEFTVETEFHANPRDDDEGCSHANTTTCMYCSHSYKSGGELCVDGRRVEPGTPFHSLFSAAVEVW